MYVTNIVRSQYRIIAIMFFNSSEQSAEEQENTHSHTHNSHTHTRN